MRDLIRPDASISPREIFARMQGAWLEPRQGSMWQTNTAATAATSGGQTIGLLIGLDKPMTLGPELLTNGDFRSGSSGWTVDGDSWTITTGAATRKTVYVGGSFYQYLPFTNKLVLFTVTVQTNNVSGVSVQFSTSAYADSTIKTGTYTFLIYGGTAVKFSSSPYPSTGNLVITAVSAREVLSSYAVQTTAANRPTLQFNGNLPLIRHADSTDVLVAAMPDLGGGVFSTAGSVYFATPQGMSCLHNQSIGTTYNLPALQTDIYGTVITPARLAPPLEQRLALYMHWLAGLVDADFFWQEQATDGMEGQLLADDNDTILLRA